MVQRLLRACAGATAAWWCSSGASGLLHLRVCNSGTVLLEHVWVGQPRYGVSTDLGPIAPAQCSRWNAVPALPAYYRKANIVAAGKPWIHVLHGELPNARPLQPGQRYTFAYALQPAGLQLRITQERAEAP